MMSTINSPLCLSLLENSPSFIIIIDENKSIYWLNQSFCDFIGVDRDEVIGLSEKNSKEACLRQVLLAKKRVELFSGIFDKWIELDDVMMLNSRDWGEADQELTVCFYSDASQKIKIENQMVQLEHTIAHKMPYDSITGLLTHQSMHQSLNTEVSRSRRYNNPLSLVLMNVDYKSYNEIDDHKEQVRLTISQLLKDKTRWADTIGHIEQHDFALLLPETAFNSAETLINKLNTSLQYVNLDEQYFSYGISQWQKGDDVTMFVQRAVKNMQLQCA